MFDVFLLQVSLNREVECLWFQCCQMSSSGQSRWTTGTPNSVCDYVLKWCIYCVHFISLNNTEWSSTCFYVCHILSLGDKWRAEDAIAKLNEKYGKQVLISFYIGTDDRDSNSHIIHVRVHFVFSFLFKSVFFLCVLLLFFFLFYEVSFPFHSFVFYLRHSRTLWWLSLSAKHCPFKQGEPLCSCGNEPKTHNHKISMNKQSLCYWNLWRD